MRCNYCQDDAAYRYRGTDAPDPRACQKHLYKLRLLCVQTQGKIIPTTYAQKAKKARRTRIAKARKAQS